MCSRGSQRGLGGSETEKLVTNINYIKIKKTNTTYNSGALLVNLYICYDNMTNNSCTNMTACF